MNMLTMTEEIFSAMRLIQEDETAKRTFRTIEEEGGKASGWHIAKFQDADPDSVAKALQTLKTLGVVESTGKGLEGYYYLTSLGFQLREHLIKRLAK